MPDPGWQLVSRSLTLGMGSILDKYLKYHGNIKEPLILMILVLSVAGRLLINDLYEMQYSW